MLREMSSGPCPWGGRWLQIDPSIKWIQFGLQMALALEMRLERRERPRISRALVGRKGRCDSRYVRKSLQGFEQERDLASLICDDSPGCCVESGLEASN